MCPSPILKHALSGHVSVSVLIRCISAIFEKQVSLVRVCSPFVSKRLFLDDDKLTISLLASSGSIGIAQPDSERFKDIKLRNLSTVLPFPSEQNIYDLIYMWLECSYLYCFMILEVEDIH